jgi:hypothetical protein
LILQYVPARTYVYVNVSQKGIALQWRIQPTWHVSTHIITGITHD